MSEPAVFVLIRDGERRFFEDRWADAFLFREILWGPDELERWLTESEEIDDWADEASGGVVVDFDNRRMVWYGDEAMLEIPRVASAYDKLLQASWSGFDVEFGSRGMVDLAVAAGQSDVDDYDDESGERCSTVRQAIGYYDDDDQDAGFDDEPEEEYGDDDTRAWITLVDSEGAVRHRNVDAISEDLIRGQESAIAQLADLPDGEIPRESVVTEGLWIDQPRREIGFWGGRLAKASFPQMRQSWRGWSVRWAEQGYADQCAVSGPAGIPMSDAEALGTIAPTILSIKRFDMGTMFNVMGGHLKRSAIRATGCLWMVLCAPVLLFGAISGNWNAALITVAIVALFVIAAFKVVENKFRKNFSMSGLGQENDAEDSRASVAGPIDESERRQRLEQLLNAAGFPPLAEIEPHFSDRPSIDDLL